MQSQSAHISIIGDNELSREGLKRVLADARFSTMCIPMADLPHHMDQFPDQPNHVILIETDSGEAAVAACQLVREHLKLARLVLLGADLDLPGVRDALAAGVDGCLARDTSCTPLMLMLELVALGERILPRKVVDQFASAPATVAAQRRGIVVPTHELSNREIGILRCLVDGDPNKIIARKLGITEATVKIHVKGILRKLQVINRTQAAIWVRDSGLLDRPVQMAEQ